MDADLVDTAFAVCCIFLLWPYGSGINNAHDLHYIHYTSTDRVKDKYKGKYKDTHTHTYT